MPIKKRKELYDLLSKCAEGKIVRFFFAKEQPNYDIHHIQRKPIAIEDDGDDSCDDILGDNRESSASDSSSEEDSVRSKNAGEMEPIAQSMKEKDSINDDCTKNAFIRKIIRDDRRISHQLECSNTECTHQIVRRLKRSIAIDKSKAELDRNIVHSAPLVESAATFMKRYKDQSNALKEQKSRSMNVRLNVKKGNDVKVIVIERSTPLMEIIAQCRMKHHAGKKFNALSIVSEGEKGSGKGPLRVLTDMDLLTISDGSELLLCEIATTSSSSTEQANCGKEAPIVEKPEDDENGRSDDNATGAVKSPERRFWMPPDYLEDAEDGHSEGAIVISPNAAVSLTLLNDLTALHGSAHFTSNVKEKRESLPIFQLRESILFTIQSNQFVIVAGEPGSGKTTQLPMYILENMIEDSRGSECCIICTQPRRIAAISIAERVSYENGSAVGDLIGYQIRLNKRAGIKTRLLFCTTGVLLRKLQDPTFLKRVSHIVIDEVHERQVEVDFLLTLMKEKAPFFPELRIVLMSATMQESLFSEYFYNCPIIIISGRSFPVELHYLEEINKLIGSGSGSSSSSSSSTGAGSHDNNTKGKGGSSKQSGRQDFRKKDPGDFAKSPASMIRPPKFDAERIADIVIRIITRRVSNSKDLQAAGASTPTVRRIDAIHQKAAIATNKLDKEIKGKISEPGKGMGDCILVFLSGIRSINSVLKALGQKNLKLMKATVSVVHGSLPPDQQRQVFRKTFQGEWKIVLATNIAETSITIDDVTHVVDIGFVKEMRYDPVGNISCLRETFISKASGRQRAGRAGRVRPGNCWRVYTEEFFNSDRVEDQPIPEIRRVPLEEVILQVLYLRLGRPELFLGKCLQPPSMEQMTSSVANLIESKAVLPLKELPITALGYHLAKMPLDVKLGKMLIYSSLLDCVEPVLTIVASMSGKSPFLLPMDRKGEASNAHASLLFSYTSSNLTRKTYFSDHLAIAHAYDVWVAMYRHEGYQAAYNFCQKKFLSHSVMLDILDLRENIRSHLVNAGFISNSSPLGGRGGDADEDDSDSIDDDFTPQKVPNTMIAGKENADRSKDDSEHSRKRDMNRILCAVCAGLSPNIFRLAEFRRDESKKSKGTTKKGKAKSASEKVLKIVDGGTHTLSIDPPSLLQGKYQQVFDSVTEYSADSPRRYGRRVKDAYFVYHKKVSTTDSTVSIYDCSVIPHAAVLLFGGDLNLNRTRDKVYVGDWIKMPVNELHAVLFKKLQVEVDSVLQCKVENPGGDISERLSELRDVIDSVLADVD